jgi:hypothetical protein
VRGSAPCAPWLVLTPSHDVAFVSLSRAELLIGKRVNSGAFSLVYVGRYRGEVRRHAAGRARTEVEHLCAHRCSHCSHCSLFTLVSTYRSSTAPVRRRQSPPLRACRPKRLCACRHVNTRQARQPGLVVVVVAPLTPPARRGASLGTARELDTQANYTKEVNLVKSFDHPHVLRFVGVCCEPPHVCIGARPLPPFISARAQPW